MSEPVTALGGAVSESGIAHIGEASLQGMITLRGDLANKVIQDAATGVAGVDMPAQGHANCDGQSGICWMSPDELLVLSPYDAVGDAIERMHDIIGSVHALAVNVSDARASFHVRGPHAREVMSKLCPVDLSPEAFAPGMFRRTRMAQVPAAFWMSDAQTFRIICFRSHAQYVFDLLTVAAQSGSEVNCYKGDPPKD